jgi:DNA polymerase III subunit gamma/tau
VAAEAPDLQALTPSSAPSPAGDHYQALYRRYRPRRFSEVRGQEHVTRALRNAVRGGRVAHAYLFSGPRGTGKTSTARILAMALNCEAPVDGEPDGTCASCVSVRSGASMDVFELDAASNRKLDEMRDLLSRVALGTPGRWKVYIVDEVHQLTPDAASALLKTLEEPPPHVVFVLATTDPQKVLPTIQSRTQHFQFHLLDGDVLASLLEAINRDADLGLSPDAVHAAVQRGRGSARDAESALEQLAAIGTEEEDGAPLVDLAASIANRDAGAVLQTVARAVAAGRDPRRLGSDLVEHLRDAFLANQAPSLVLLPGSEKAQLADEAQTMGLPLLVRCMETIGQALVEMRDSVDPRVTLEVALVRLASPAADTSPAALLERIERLERALGEKGGSTVAPVSPGGTVPGAPNAVRRGLQGVPSGGASGASGGSGEPPSPGGAPAKELRSGTSGPAGEIMPAAEMPAPTPFLPAPTGPAQARVALGALLKGAGAAGPQRGGDGAPSAAAEGARGLPGAGGVSATSAVAGAASPRTGTAHALPSGDDAGARPVAGPLATAGTGVAPEQGGPSGGQGALPTREELTKAWGDSVLVRLDRPAQVFLATGRFASVDDAAVFALPDASHVDRAGKFVPQAEAALAAHFGRSVPLRLVVDRPAPVPQPAKVPPPDDDVYDLDELAGAQVVPAVTAEQLILDAFPGAVLDG